MRSFEERKAEIFNRSNKRIQIKKRNRNRIVAGCMSLSLLAIVSFVVIIMPKIGKDNKKHNDNNTGTWEEVFLPTYVQSDGIEEIVDSIKDFDNSEESNEIGTGSLVESATENDEMASVEIYEFITVDSSGNEIHYKLQGNTLYNISEGSVKYLSDTQVQKIKQKLNLTQ